MRLVPQPTLTAIRFHVNESSKFSPFCLIYNRDVVLPLDTILTPHKRYYGDDEFQICLQYQHKSFTLVHRHMEEAKRRQKEYADRGSKDDNFQVSDPVYLWNHRRTNKLDVKWSPFCRIKKKVGESNLNVHVRSQLDGTGTRKIIRYRATATLRRPQI